MLYHTTCHSCFSCYKRTFKSPESFRRFIAAAGEDDLQEDNDEEEEQLGTSTSIDEEMDEVAQVSHMDSAIMHAHKVKKRRELIKNLTLAHVKLKIPQLSMVFIMSN